MDPKNYNFALTGCFAVCAGIEFGELGECNPILGKKSFCKNRLYELSEIKHTYLYFMTHLDDRSFPIHAATYLFGKAENVIICEGNDPSGLIQILEQSKMAEMLERTMCVPGKSEDIAAALSIQGKIRSRPVQFFQMLCIPETPALRLEAFRLTVLGDDLDLYVSITFSN